jgi:hypothetical protein
MRAAGWRNVLEQSIVARPITKGRHVLMRTRHWGTTIGGVALAAALAAATLASNPAEARWRGCWGCGALAVGAIAGAAVASATYAAPRYYYPPPAAAYPYYGPAYPYPPARPCPLYGPLPWYCR